MTGRGWEGDRDGWEGDNDESSNYTIFRLNVMKINTYTLSHLNYSYHGA